MERKLASIRKILDIRPIEGADNIMLAKIDGWDVIVKKDEFKIDDLCVYCEIDSVLPERPEFEFLRTKHFRIKTMKLSKFDVISQGIIFPVSILSANKQLNTDVNPIPKDERLYPVVEFVPCEDGHQLTVFFDDVGEKYLELNEGDDVTELLCVTKNEVAEPGTMGERKSTFPVDIPKTDEERIQNLVKFIPRWRNVEFIETEKIDGTSSTYVLRTSDETVGVQFDACSRNMTLVESDNLYWRIAKKYDFLNKMKELANYNPILYRNFAVQGEIAGPGVQSNRLGLSEVAFYMFNAFDVSNQRYMEWEEIEYVAQFLGVQTVPVISMSYYLGEKNVNDILKNADLPSMLNPNVIREGNVYRSKHAHPALSQFGKISFKALSNAYLLKHKV